MSGVEVVGILLGVLPLLISAAENYKKTTSRPFQRWKDFNSELEKFQANLQCQECIFRNECQILLSSVTGWQPEESEKKFDLGSGVQWSTYNLNLKFEKYLGKASKPVFEVIKQIDETLSSIESKCQKFESVAEPNTQVSIERWRYSEVLNC